MRPSVGRRRLRRCVESVEQSRLASKLEADNPGAHVGAGELIDQTLPPVPHVETDSSSSGPVEPAPGPEVD